MHSKNRLYFFLFGFIFVYGCSGIVHNRELGKEFVSTPLKTPYFAQKTLSNGLTIYYQKNDILPLFKGVLYFPEGSAALDCEVPGLSQFTVSMVREGGTSSRTPDVLDSYLDSNAIEVESSQSEDFTSFSVSSLSEDTEKALSIFSEIIAEPRFDNNRILLSKELTKDEISRRKDDADTMASLLFNMGLYGERSPWYCPITTESLSRITRKSITSYYNRFLNVQGAYLVASSQLPEDEFFMNVEKLFSRLPGRDRTNVSSSRMQIAGKDTIPTLYVLRKNFTQASIFMGQKSKEISLIDPYKMTLFNRVFGSGSFDSLLFREVRDKRGLAYGVSGGFSASRNRGIFYVKLATQTSQVIPAITAVNNVYTDVLSNGFTEEHIQGAIKSNLLTFVFRFEDSFMAITRPVLLSLSGFPATYDSNYQESMISLSGNNLKDFASKELPDGISILAIVGNVAVEQLKNSDIGKRYRICEADFEEVPRLIECK